MIKERKDLLSESAEQNRHLGSLGVRLHIQ